MHAKHVIKYIFKYTFKFLFDVDVKTKIYIYYNNLKSISIMSKTAKSNAKLNVANLKDKLNEDLLDLSLCGLETVPVKEIVICFTFIYLFYLKF